MLTEQEKRDAEEIVNSNLTGHAYEFYILDKENQITACSMPIEAAREFATFWLVAGIEHEKKKDFYRIPNDFFKLPADMQSALVQAAANMIVGFPKAVIHCKDGDLELPIEQVGERHWRIKDVVGFPKTVVTIQGKELQVLSEPEYLSKLAGND